MSKTVMVVDDSGSFRMVVKRAPQKAEGKAAGVRAWITQPIQPAPRVEAVDRLGD